MSAWTTSCDCPACGDTLPFTDGDGLVVCDCGAPCWVELDGDADAEGRQFNLYRVTLEERCNHTSPAAWRTCSRCLDAEGGV